MFLVFGLVKALIVSYLGSWRLPELWLGLIPEKLCKLQPCVPGQDMMTKHLKHLLPVRQVSPTEKTHTHAHAHTCTHTHVGMHMCIPAVGNTIEIYAHRKSPSKKYLSQRHLCYHSLTPVLPGPLLAPACAILWVQPKHAGEPNIFITESQKTKILLSQAGPKNVYCES